MEELVTLTQDLIRFKTMHSQPEEIQHCIAFIEDYLKTCGAKYSGWIITTFRRLSLCRKVTSLPSY